MVRAHNRNFYSEHALDAEKALLKKILAVALAMTLTAGPVLAQGHHRDHRAGGGGWVAPLVGGLIIGGIVGGAMSQPRYVAPGPVYVAPPVPVCWDEIVGYDYWRRPVYQRVCR